MEYELVNPVADITGLVFDSLGTSSSANVVFKPGSIIVNNQLFDLPLGLTLPKLQLDTIKHNLIFFKVNTQTLFVLNDVTSKLGNCSNNELILEPGYIENNLLLGGIDYINGVVTFTPKTLVYYDITEDMVNYAKDIKEVYLCTGSGDPTNVPTVVDLIGLINNDNLEAIVTNMVCAPIPTSVGTSPSWAFTSTDTELPTDYLHLQNNNKSSVEYIKVPTLQTLRTFLPSYTDEDLIKAYWLLKYMPSVYYSSMVTETIQEL